MGFFGGGGVAKSASQGATSNARDPAVRRTGTNTGTQTRGSSPRPPTRKPTKVERTVYNVTGNIARDLNMGFSTFGQSKEKQTATLQAAGYSDDVIKDYQARTEATKARMASMNTRTEYGRDDSRPAPVSAPVAAAPSAPSASTTTTATPTPPPAPAPIGEDMSAPEAGSAEEKVVEGAKTRKGRASTIQTGPSGLLTQARTRRRRSLMGGGEPSGLIS
jgi:hypothetical protein